LPIMPRVMPAHSGWPYQQVGAHVRQSNVGHKHLHYIPSIVGIMMLGDALRAVAHRGGGEGAVECREVRRGL